MGLLKTLYYLIRPQSNDSEWLEIGGNIETLSREVLNTDEFEEAEILATDIVSGGNRKRQAIMQLQNRIGTRPKRPMYYVTEQFLPHLPYYTREIMRYLGDYLDQLVKCVAKEKHKGLIYIPRSIGSNLHTLKGVIPSDFQKQLMKYNKDIYVPAKHDFDVRNRKHRFTCKEVVFTIIMTVKFGERLKAMSPLARQYSEDRLPD